MTAVALEVGYESSQTFARAFRAVAGVSATEARESVATLRTVGERLARPSVNPAEEPSLQIEVISLDPFEVAAVRKVGPHGDLYGTYRELARWAAQRGLVLRGVWGVPQDDPRETPDAERVFECCADLGPGVTDDEPVGVRLLTLGGGPWARVRHEGPYEKIDESYDRLYHALVGLEGYELDDRPLLNHYLDGGREVPRERRRTDLHVPLRPSEHACP